MDDERRITAERKNAPSNGHCGQLGLVCVVCRSQNFNYAGFMRVYEG